MSRLEQSLNREREAITAVLESRFVGQDSLDRRNVKQAGPSHKDAVEVKSDQRVRIQTFEP